MNILVTYSSLTGNTKKLAEGIQRELYYENSRVMPISEVRDLEYFDVVLVGYWVDKGGPNEEAKEFMKTLEGKVVGIFATLGAYADSQHGWNSLVRGEELIKDKNTVLGKFICQGKVDEKILEKFKSLPEGHPHRPTPESNKRRKIAAMHPNELDIKYAAEMFKERLFN